MLILEILNERKLIARLTQQPIKKIRLNNKGVFEEVKNPFCNNDLD